MVRTRQHHILFVVRGTKRSHTHALMDPVSLPRCRLCFCSSPNAIRSKLPVFCFCFVQIVYANDMSDGSPWIECDDSVGEDYACDPQVSCHLSLTSRCMCLCASLSVAFLTRYVVVVWSMHNKYVHYSPSTKVREVGRYG